MATPQPTASETRNHQTFSALMWALSYPGRPQRLPFAAPGAYAAIGDALLDIETSFFTDDAALHTALLRTGARPLGVDRAGYQFYPQLSAAACAGLVAAPMGTFTHPDRGATLVIGCALGEGRALTLSGPGLPRPATIHIGGLPSALWQVRRRCIRYPLGWDIVLVDGEQLVGIPRTSSVEEA